MALNMTGILRKTVDIVAEKDERFTKLRDITGILGDHKDVAENSLLAFTNAPHYDVYEITYDRSQRNLSSLVAGTQGTIALQCSMLNAIYDIVHEGNDNESLDLNEWLADFKACFPSFKIKDPPYNAVNAWNEPAGCGPFIRILRSPRAGFLTNTDSQANSFFANTVNKGLRYNVLQFWPEYCNRDESYLISGTTSMCILQINQLYNQWLMFGRRSIGEWVGYPVEEDLRRYPRNYVTIQFLLTTNKKPPFYRTVPYVKKRQYTSTNINRGIYQSPKDHFEPFREIVVTVPLVDPKKVTYETLRACCGGASGISVGYWGAITELGSSVLNSYTKLIVRGSSFDVAVENTKRFLSITTDSIVIEESRPIRYAKSEKADKIDGNYDKLKAYHVYPAKVLITTSTIQTAKPGNQGRKVRTGVKNAQSVSLDLHTESAPYDWADGLKSIGL